MTEAVKHAVVECAGVPIWACTMQEATQLVIERALTESPAGAHVHLCNAYTLALADKDQPFKDLLNRSTFNFPDGMSVVWANRWRHRDMELPRERVCGPDLFLHVFDQGQQMGLRHYLLGSTPEVMTDLQQELLARFPQARIVGSESPPFRTLTNEEQADQLDRIRDSGAQVVWVGLGTPKQDWAAQALAHELDTRLRCRRGCVRLRRRPNEACPEVDAEERTGVGVPAGLGATAPLAALLDRECPVHPRNAEEVVTDSRVWLKPAVAVRLPPVRTPLQRCCRAGAPRRSGHHHLGT